MLAKQEHRVFPASQVNIVIHPWIPPLVCYVQLVGHRKEVALNAKRVKLEKLRTVMTLEKTV
jgi:hypothetical protein